MAPSVERLGGLEDDSFYGAGGDDLLIVGQGNDTLLPSVLRYFVKSAVKVEHGLPLDLTGRHSPRHLG